MSGLRRKIGLFQSRPGDSALIQDLLERMTENTADFTLTFRALCDAAVSADGDAAARALFKDASAFDDWAVKWRARLAEDGGDANARRDAMRAVNPRVHSAQSSRRGSDRSGGARRFRAVRDAGDGALAPFDDQPDFARYADPPRPEEVVHQTFCGT